MQTKQQQLAQKLARLDTLESHRRAMLDEYMPIKNEIEILKDDIDALETELLSVEQVEDDKRFDELITELKEEEKDYLRFNQQNEEEQLIAEIKNPEDYTNFDTKDLESSIV